MLVFVELYVIALITLIFVLAKMLRARKKFLYKSPIDPVDAGDYPAVSVCIPARNETNAMTECLERVLSSDYPKLEIIVLDDNSSDNTSHIIRAFAHSGVRFVQGDKLPSDWLGKNFSLQNLAEESSGSLVLFMDVDTRLESNSIRLMVEKMMAERVKMISVIPQRYDTSRSSSWLSTLRYFWELVLHSQNIPGVSSSAWLIDRQLLMNELGGFGEWRDEVQPESHIASELSRSDEYRLIFSTPELGVHYEKKWTSQLETSRRLLLPRFGNSITSVLLGAGLVCSVILSQVVIIMSIVEQSWWMVGAQGLLALLTLASFVIYYKMALRTKWFLGVIASPYVVWQELVLLVASAIGYKSGTITWKGRVVQRTTRKRTLM